jgi:hypothetical protein
LATIEEKPGTQHGEASPSRDECWALVERVAASEQFSRSARLRDFLLYVGRQSLMEGCQEIHEQEIGAQVFGRPAAYDRSSDNIVRVNATELRKRIESYFESLGAGEPLLFEIPRGSYVPVFRRRFSGRVSEALTPHQETAPEPESRQRQAGHRAGALRLASRIGWPLASLALAIGCVMLWEENRAMRKALHPWENQPAVAAFWTGFLDPNRQTDLVLPDDSASVMEDITGNPLTLGDYLNRGYNQQIDSSAMSADRKQDVHQILNHNLVTFGAVRAAQVLLGEIPPGDPHYLTLARYFTADEMKRDNVVLIGGKKSVPWDYLFDDELNFVTDYDYAHALQVVRNRNPRPGEQPVYAVSLAGNSLSSYTVIAYLPNPSRNGSVIILAGTDSDATGAAAAFLTSEEQMARLRKTFGSDRFPYFEALLKTTRLSGTFFNAELVAYRTYPNLR